MSTWAIVLIIVAVVLAVTLAVLTFLGKRAEEKQKEQKAQLDAIAQTTSVLVIDKKKMKIKDAGLPAIVEKEMPKRAKLVKFPIVKCKVGPKIMTFLCDEDVFNIIPVKKECKVVISGLYITAVKSARGGLDTAPVKKGFLKRQMDKLQKMR